MSHGQRLGSDPLDWIASALAPAGASATAPVPVATPTVATLPDAQAQRHPVRPEAWRALRLKGDAKECKGELSQQLDRAQAADMLETLAAWIREGGCALGEGGKALMLAVGEELDVEAAVSHKKDKTRVQMEIAWKNRKA